MTETIPTIPTISQPIAAPIATPITIPIATIAAPHGGDAVKASRLAAALAVMDGPGLPQDAPVAPSTSAGPAGPAGPENVTEASAAPPASAASPPSAPEPLKMTREERLELLGIAKAKRQADEAIRRAKQVQQAETAATKWKEDPKAFLDSYGIDHREYSQRLLDQSLGVAPKPQTVEQKLAEVSNQLREVQERRDQQEVNHIVETQCVPILTGPQSDRFEALIANFNGNASSAAMYVIREIQKVFNETKQIIPFEKAAAYYDKKFEERLDLGIKSVMSTKRFSSRFKTEDDRKASSDSPREIPAEQTSKDETALIDSLKASRRSTITNNVAFQTGSVGPRTKSIKDERLQRAMSLLNAKT